MNETVLTRNYSQNDNEKNEVGGTYQWIVRLNNPGDGGRNDALPVQCETYGGIGDWKSLGYSNADENSCKYTVAVTEGNEIEKQIPQPPVLKKVYDHPSKQDFNLGQWES